MGCGSYGINVLTLSSPSSQGRSRGAFPMSAWGRAGEFVKTIARLLFGNFNQRVRSVMSGHLALHSYDYFPFVATFCEVSERFRHLTQLVYPVDNWHDLTGFHELFQSCQPLTWSLRH